MQIYFLMSHIGSRVGTLNSAILIDNKGYENIDKFITFQNDD